MTTTKDNVKQSQDITPHEIWRKNCHIIQSVTFFKSSTDASMRIRVAIGNVKAFLLATIGPWSQTGFIFSSETPAVWCQKRAEAIRSIQNTFLECIPEPVGMIATLKLYSDVNLENE